MRRRHIHKTRLARQSVYKDSFLIDWHTLDQRPERFEQKTGRQITRIFNRNQVARPQEGAGYEIESLLRATGDRDVVSGSLDASGDSNVPRYSFPQALMACGMGVHSCTHGFPIGFASNQSAPSFMRE